VRVWLPLIRAGTGADVFMQNLAAGLERQEVPVSIAWFSRLLELCPVLLGGPGRLPVPDADIIHANCDYAFPFAGRGVPLVVTLFHWVHGPDFVRCRGPIQGLYHRLLLRRRQQRSLRAATAITTISAYSARQLQAALPGVQPRVIYPGVDTDFFQPGPARAPDGVFRLLFIGSPSRRKGFDLLPRIAAGLGPGFQVRYAEGPDVAGGTILHRTGRLTRAQLLAEYRDCDALIFPTRYEGFGLAAAEAMACAKPVIASNCTSLPELVQDGVTGILCPVDNVAAFVAAARRLDADHGAARAMGCAGRERVLQHFTLAHMAVAYIDLYRALRAGSAAHQEKETST